LFRRGAFDLAAHGRRIPRVAPALNPDRGESLQQVQRSDRRLNIRNYHTVVRQRPQSLITLRNCRHRLEVVRQRDRRQCNRSQQQDRHQSGQTIPTRPRLTLDAGASKPLTSKQVSRTQERCETKPDEIEDEFHSYIVRV
jgi:hypothetical protein